MIGLLYIIFFVVYGFVSIFIIYKSYGFAKARYGKGWIGGWLAVLIMYNLVFWDWVPVYVMHKYYCSTQAGFWIYKSPEQWVKENPDVVGQKWGDDYIRPIDRISDNHWRTWYSKSIYGETISQPKYSGGLLGRTEKRLIDARSGNVLSRAVQFKKINESALAVGNSNLTDFKIWLAVGGNVCLSRSGQDFNVLDAQNSKKLFSLGRGIKQ